MSDIERQRREAAYQFEICVRCGHENGSHDPMNGWHGHPGSCPFCFECRDDCMDCK